MSRRFTKIICTIIASVVALGILLVAGCSDGHTDKALGGDMFTGEVKSNGGFAVEKGNYIYFINGAEGNTAENDYGTPVKGAISRISVEDYKARKYSNTDIVVPQIAYSGNHSAGIFIYGDEIYYGTPSTAKNVDGAVQNDKLEMQSTKLDRSKTSAPYITFDDLYCEYRYVQAEDGTVYLLYIATGEKLYDEDSGVTNIHSLNTKTGKNTLLAYNVDSYLFDAENKTNTRIYYTMKVKDYASGNNASYNQIYTVTAEVTKENEYDTSGIIGWDKDNDHYINCGQLVFEGIGGKTDNKTPFNYKPDDATALNKRSYSYELKTYLNGTLVFTRSNTDIGSSEKYLYTYKDGTIDKEGCDPLKLNEDETVGIEGKELLKNGSSADNYRYIFDDKGDLKAVLSTESSGGISVNYVKADGKLHEKKNEENNLRDSKYFNIVKEGTATILFLDRENEFVYYSLSGSGTNGNSVWRVDYSSDNYENYEEHKFEPDNYSPVQILDVDSVTDWYLPEIIENQLIYATAASDMTLYTYIMVCDLRNDKGEPMGNDEIRDLNKLYEDLKDAIKKISESDKYPSEKYKNIENILNYGFYTQDTTYIYEHQKKVNAGLDEEENLPISDESLEEYVNFLNPTADNNWKDFTAKKSVNGKTVYATYRSYYYSLLGKMTSADKDGYQKSLVGTYLPLYSEGTTTWWDGLSTVAKVFFIIGMCIIGLAVIAGITILVIFLVKRKKKGESAPKRRRIRVDTTDDKSIDVYNN